MTLNQQRTNDIQTISASVGSREIEHLINRIANDAETGEDLEATVLSFLSLGTEDLEAVLTALRAKAVSDPEIPESERAFLRSNGEILASLARDLNKASMKAHKIPFHLALAQGKGSSLEKLVASKNLGGGKPFGTAGPGDGREQREECPTDYYPRYVPHNSPWKLRASFNITTKQRPQDVGCHFQHGPFQGTIRGWVTFSPQTAAMVSLQGWGFNLAASNSYLFYKWWFVAMMGMTPFTCMNTLYIRRF